MTDTASGPCDDVAASKFEWAVRKQWPWDMTIVGRRDMGDGGKCMDGSDDLSCFVLRLPIKLSRYLWGEGAMPRAIPRAMPRADRRHDSAQHHAHARHPPYDILLALLQQRLVNARHPCTRHTPLNVPVTARHIDDGRGRCWWHGLLLLLLGHSNAAVSTSVCWAPTYYVRVLGAHW